MVHVAYFWAEVIRHTHSLDIDAGQYLNGNIKKAVDAAAAADATVTPIYVNTAPALLLRHHTR